MSGTENAETGERMRLCPSCRMSISILATKCRFCGEVVSRPREESRRLSYTDLGGERPTQFVPSESVMGALEAFRREVIGEQANNLGDDLPALDTDHLDMASLGKPAASMSRSRLQAQVARRKQSSSNVPRIAMISAAVVLMIVGIFVGANVLGKKRSVADDLSQNSAYQLLQNGGSGLDALRAAMNEVNQKDSLENRTVLDQARDKLKVDVETILSSEPFDLEKIRKASEMASSALLIEPDGEAIKKLKEDVDEEAYSYKTTINQIAPDKSEVKLKVIRPDQTSDIVVKKEGENVNKRLKLKRIMANHVVFEDTMRKTKNGMNRSFKLTTDGNISIE